MDATRLSALKSKYEAAQTPDAVLADEFGIGLSRLRVLVNNNGWVKRTPPTEEQVQKSVHLFSFDSNEQAVLSAAQVVAMHRKDVARLRSISAILVDRLGIELAGKPLQDAEGNPLICRGSRESPADLLEKLSRVQVRTTEIERQAYGLKTFDPDKGATEEELQKELDKLTEEVEQIARDKAIL